MHKQLTKAGRPNVRRRDWDGIIETAVWALLVIGTAAAWVWTFAGAGSIN